MQKTLAATQKYASIVFLASTSLLFLFVVTGCSGTFISDAPNIIEAILAAISSLSGVLTLLVPGAAQVFAILNAVTAEVQKIDTLVEQYKTTPDETLLAKIEAAIQEAITNIDPLLAPVGVSASVATKIGAIAQLILGQLEAWIALFPKSHSATSATVMPSVTALRLPHVVVHVPRVAKLLSSKDLSKAVNAILDAPTGDPATDAAFAKAARLKVA